MKIKLLLALLFFTSVAYSQTDSQTVKIPVDFTVQLLTKIPVIHDTIYVRDSVYKVDTVFVRDSVFNGTIDTIFTFQTVHDTAHIFLSDTVYITDTTKANKLLLPNTKTSSYTLQYSDAGQVIELNCSTSNTVTVDNSLPVGSQVVIVQYGTGITTVVPSGVTISGTLVLKQYSGVVLWKRADNEYILFNQ